MRGRAVVRDGSQEARIVERSSSGGKDASVPVRRLLLLLALVAGLLPLAGVTAATPAAAYPTTSNQLITVRVSSPTATVGQLRAYDRVDGAWKLRIGPVTARVGAAGVGPASEGSTPTPGGDSRGAPGV